MEYSRNVLRRFLSKSVNTIAQMAENAEGGEEEGVALMEAGGLLVPLLRWKR